MAEPALKPPTYQDLVDLPPHLVGEIVAGELYASPRPSSAHGRVQTALGHGVGGPFDLDGDGPGGWWFLFEPELHLGGNVMVPDIAAWRRENMAAIPDVPWFDQAPDWICEVVSPSTARLDRALKLPAYARAGVAHAWIVDPRQRTLEVFRNSQGGWLLVSAHGDDDVVEAEPFGAVPLELAGLWLPRSD